MRQFYNNPELSVIEVEELDWANWGTLMAVQAFLGAISSNVVGVAVEPGPASVTVHLALRADSASDADEIEHTLYVLDALFEGHVAIDHTISTGCTGAGDVHGPGRRLVYAAMPTD